MGVYKYLNVGRDVQELDSGKKITFLLGFALVEEMSGCLSQLLNLTFPLYFWLETRQICDFLTFVRKSYIFDLFLTKNTREKSNLRVSTNIATHFLN